MTAPPSANSVRDAPDQVTFSIRIDFLTRPALSETSRRGQGFEWPPHPHRLFAAMTAAHYEANVGSRETLQWLERLPPPAITASDVHVRTFGSFYVPVNDPISKKSFEKSSTGLPLADRRVRQERTFAVGSLLPSASDLEGETDRRSVYYTWRSPEHPPIDLDQILREVTRLGHSSSLVAASVWSSEPPAPTHVAAEHGEIQLRVPEEGTLARLDEAHAVRGLATRLQEQREALLEADAWAGYNRVDREAPVQGPWREHWVWTLEPRISVTAWIHLAEAIRGTILSHLPQDSPDLLTGHSEGNHLAVIPLPHVGHPHADASVLGFAVLSPPLDEEVRDTLLLALAELRQVGAKRQLRAGPAGDFRAEVLPVHDLRRTVRLDDWSRPSCWWATVTPLVFDRFPKAKLPPEEIVAGSVERLGLPAPAEVVVRRSGELTGTPRSQEFRVRRPGWAPGRRPDHRPWSHAVLRWERPVEGPIVLGAMRHFGLGLCKPISPAWRAEGSERGPTA